MPVALSGIRGKIRGSLPAPIFDYTPAKIIRLYERCWLLCDFYRLGSNEGNWFVSELATENTLNLLLSMACRLFISNAFLEDILRKIVKIIVMLI